MNSTQQSPLEELRSLHRGSAVGASEAEVAAVEQQLGIRLPADYRAFLLWMGRDKRGMWEGSDCFVDDIVRITEALPKLLEENGLAHELPAKYVCVLMHQGYIATWFEVPAESDDPPAYVFNEGQLQLGVQTGKSVMQTFLDDYRALSSL